MTISGPMIDKGYILALPEFDGKERKDITQGDLARVSRDEKGSSQKSAMDLVNAYKEEYGNGVSTLIVIYNSTGDPLLLDQNYDKSGHIGKYPYDTRIENGQWSSILHVHTSSTMRGSVAAIRYRIGNSENFFSLGWSTPYTGNNRCYVEVAEGVQAAPASAVSDRADEAEETCTSKAGLYYADASIGNNSSPQLVASVVFLPSPNQEHPSNGL